MGPLLERLLCDSQTVLAATPATLATLPVQPTRKVAGSQESQGIATAKAREQRAHLLALADDEGLLAALVHGLDDADVAACAGMLDATLRAYLRALDRRQRMDAGIVPLDWGEPEARTCEGCGSVPLWPTCPGVVEACPWCWRRRAGKAVPRPQVVCGDCRRYLPGVVNPAAGMGGCGLGCGRASWPMKPHRCADWRGSQD